MAPQVTASPGEVKSTAPLPSPTLPPSSPSLVKRADHALTTPYVFPPECAPIYSMTSKTFDLADSNYGTVVETFLWHDISSNQHFSSCQPTGAAGGYIKKFGFEGASSVFSGAVCPSGWKAFEVGLTSWNRHRRLAAETWSTAHCCRSGDTYGTNYWSLHFGDSAWRKIDHPSVCISTSKSDGALTSGRTYPSYVVPGRTSYLTTFTATNKVDSDGNPITNTGTYTEEDFAQLTLNFVHGRAFYAPMSMEWFEEDNKTLDPKWPTLTSDMLLPTWTPGEKIYTNEYGRLDNKGKGKTEVPPPSMPNKVAIPVIATLATLLGICLGALLFLLWRGKRQAKGSHKIVEDQHLGMPVGAEGGSTAHLNGQAGDEMELREREVAR